MDDVRVERSFGFVDLGGFTSFTEERGDEQAVQVLSLFRSAVRDVASRNGVRVAKWLGDGAMFVAVTTPELICTVLEIEERIDEVGSPLPLRAGLAEGPVILFEGDDYIGSAVNLAARLCDTAQAHQVLATTDVASVAPEWVRASPVGMVLVAGFGFPVEAFDLSRRAHTQAVAS